MTAVSGLSARTPKSTAAAGEQQDGSTLEDGGPPPPGDHHGPQDRGQLRPDERPPVGVLLGDPRDGGEPEHERQRPSDTGGGQRHLHDEEGSRKRERDEDDRRLIEERIHHPGRYAHIRVERVAVPARLSRGRGRTDAAAGCRCRPVGGGLAVSRRTCDGGGTNLWPRSRRLGPSRQPAMRERPFCIPRVAGSLGRLPPSGQRGSLVATDMRSRSDAQSFTSDDLDRTCWGSVALDYWPSPRVS